MPPSPNETSRFNSKQKKNEQHGVHAQFNFNLMNLQDLKM